MALMDRRSNPLMGWTLAPDRLWGITMGKSYDAQDQSHPAYAIVRRDRLAGQEFNPDDFSPPGICGGEYSYTVKEVVLDEGVAIREVDRLNSIAKAETRYFWTGTHLFTDGGSHGESPRASAYQEDNASDDQSEDQT